MDVDATGRGLERGRLSSGHSSRVLGCEPDVGGRGIVPAAQADRRLAHPHAMPLRASVQTHSLMPLLDVKHLRTALRQCGRRASAPGADKMTLAELRRRSGELLPRLAEQLAEGAWQPGPLRQVGFPTYTGKPMAVFVPTLIDRVVHRALRNAIEPILEAGVLRDWVSGYRPRRNRITALRHAAAHIEAGLRAVADVDVATVSEGASVEQVVDWCAEHIHDGSFLDRVRTALTAMPHPIAPGSGLAPTLINLRLSRPDRLMDELAVVRFADNYVVFTADEAEARRAFTAIRDALARFGLRPNDAKSRVRPRANVEDLFLIGG
ncbi:reverse transcriptase domain-containing protein [Umezawaea sp. Da 62-37]|uniref:reverse transcriptase domain-containing protein n=1 Tax=Umezawaea sp. Da 62-37 TaxID=3075927 RepID=UPI0028F6CFE0|nr:reverse transcriptase domain-containing protein [Umezawaea sp. Da 62-37]WNV91874.1 reverse transcriptase domain-containing protein [Umezawaea sp. Da 62-37]